MSELSPGWRVSADGVKVQSRQTWDGETQDVDEQGNENQAAFDGAAEIDAGGLLGLTGNAATAANTGIGMGVKTAVSGKRPSLASVTFALARGWK